MSTQFFRCTECHKKSTTHQKLFDTLYDFSRTVPEGCPSCGSRRDLHVTLDFQLGAGDTDYTVVSAFLPDKLESWLGEGEEEVTFYPFLVVLESSEGKQFCWMPYWHVTRKGGTLWPARSLHGKRPVRQPDGAGRNQDAGTGVKRSFRPHPGSPNFHHLT